MLLTAKGASVLCRIVYGYTVNLTKALDAKLGTTNQLVERNAVVVVGCTLSVVEILRKTAVSIARFDTHTTTVIMSRSRLAVVVVHPSTVVDNDIVECHIIL